MLQKNILNKPILLMPMSHISSLEQFGLVFIPFSSFNSNKMSRLLAKFKLLRDEWNNKMPVEKWYIIYNFTDKLCRLIGIRVYGDMKNNWYSAAPGLACGLYFFTVIYTTHLYSKNGELLWGIQSSCISGIVVTVSKHLTLNAFQYEKSLALFF